MIEFRDVSKTYENGTHALNHVNIKINKGEFVFVAGLLGSLVSQNLIPILIYNVLLIMGVAKE